MMRNKNKGFTLIELMIVLAIVGILAAVAYPSYVEQVYKSERSKASQLMLECTQILERLYTLRGTYAAANNTDPCDRLNDQDDAKYDISVDLNVARAGRNCNANNRSNCYEVTATAIARHKDTACQTFTINDAGLKAAEDESGQDTTARCWRTT